MSRVHALAGVVLALAVAAGLAAPVASQGEISKDDRALYGQMLEDLEKDLRENYYDKAFHGLDLAGIFRAAAGKLAAAKTTAEAVDIVSNTLFSLDDSHTSFIPPQRATKVDYGWTMAAVGDQVLVMKVDAGSGAEAAGLVPGDQVLGINRYRVTRENLWQIRHYYRIVRPQAQQHLTVRKPDGAERVFDVRSRTEKRPVIQISDAIDDAVDEARRGADTSEQVEPGILVWRMRAFRDPDGIAPFVRKARDARGLVLDLRGNGGGLLDGLKALVGWTFDREIHVMTRIGRKGERREVAKPRRNPFLGKLVVLVDSRSASAAECFARTVQIEKRGVVLGDRTAGMVMTSEVFLHDFGLGASTFYGASVTISDTRMSDGGRLEKVGVTPDDLLLPAPADLAARRDPVLARAVAMLGGSLTPEQAGALFPPL